MHILLNHARLDYKHYISNIINGYFDGLQLRFFVGEETTSWQRLEKGIDGPSQ